MGGPLGVRRCGRIATFDPLQRWPPYDAKDALSIHAGEWWAIYAGSRAVGFVPRRAMPTDQKMYLVSCVATKRPFQSRARDLYVSPWFQLAKQYAETTRSPWFILSAKHGLLDPDQMI